MRPISRREVLIVAGGVTFTGAVAACAGSSEPATSSPAAVPDTARSDAAGNEHALLMAYDQTIATYPTLADALTPLRQQHADHLASLAVETPATASYTVPTTDTAAIDALRNLERAAARSRRASCVATVDPDLARLLTAIAASEASHAPALKQLANA